MFTYLRVKNLHKMLATSKDHVSFEKGNGSTGFSQILPSNTHIKGLINVRDSVSVCFSNLFRPNPSKMIETVQVLRTKKKRIAIARPCIYGPFSLDVEHRFPHIFVKLAE